MAEVVLFAAVLSMDSFGVGLVCGTKSVKIPFLIKLCMASAAVISGVVICVCGELISRLLPEKSLQVTSALLLICTGIVILSGSRESNNDGGDKNRSGVIEPAEAWLLGFTLSADMLSAGTGFALGREYKWLFPVFGGVFQFLLMNAGIWIGKRVSLPEPGKRVIEWLPGVVIIALGIVKFLKCV